MRNLLPLAVVVSMLGCQDRDTATKPSPPKPRADCVKVSLAYGSEKKVWLEEQAKAFAATGPTTAAGRCITLELKAMGSGEVTQGVLDGSLKPTVYSPASGAYLTLLNAAWVEKTGKPEPLAPAGPTLVLSPVVIAMWKPMAEALGWPKKALSWKDLIKVAQDTRGWSGLGHPEWGQFKFGHTQPEFSNSGLLAVLAVAYAGTGQTRGLTTADLDLKAVQAEIAAVERPIIHYGKSTGFFADKMITRGPGYLSAAVLYESNVIESYAKGSQLPLVAIYPQEGTFWSDHPYSVLDAPWNSPEAREAATVLLKFLRAAPAQQRALALGFRPSEPSIALAAPIDEAHGVDPKQPQTLLEVPEAATLQKLISVWSKNKKPTDVILVFDKSGSMNGSPMQDAQAGAMAFVDQLKDADQLTLVVFDNEVAPPAGPFAMATQRAQAKSSIQSLFASGGTALYDATRSAYQLALTRAKTDRDRIHAVVVMTDGQDESSKLPLEQLRSTLTSEDRTVRVFTIAYGTGADPRILDSIAEAGQGTSAKGTQANIISVFQDIGAFF
jgi:Ca-activated chloride channel homolog